LASFFVRAAAGQFDLDQPEQLNALLFQMARHKLSCEVRRQTARRRDVRQTRGGGLEGMTIAAADPTPSEWVAGRELLDEVLRRLSAEERRIAALRADGGDWAAIAAELGGTPDGRRKQLARALDRVTEQLGLDGPDGDRP
jgi:RNA polymerase sigma-70 factor (ECF subfamily)